MLRSDCSLSAFRLFTQCLKSPGHKPEVELQNHRLTLMFLSTDPFFHTLKHMSPTSNAQGSFVFPLLSVPVARYFPHSHHKEHRTAVLVCILYLAIVGTTSCTLYLHIIFSGEVSTHLIFNQTVLLLLSYKGADTL